MQAAAKELGADYKPKANGSVDSMIGGFKLYSDICDQIKDDKKLIDLLHQVLTSACYDDKECRTLTIDFGHYIGSYYQDEKKKRLQMKIGSLTDTLLHCRLMIGKNSLLTHLYLQ